MEVRDAGINEVDRYPCLPAQVRACWDAALSGIRECPMSTVTSATRLESRPRIGALAPGLFTEVRGLPDRHFLNEVCTHVADIDYETVIT